MTRNPNAYISVQALGGEVALRVDGSSGWQMFYLDPGAARNLAELLVRTADAIDHAWQSRRPGDGG